MRKINSYLYFSVMVMALSAWAMTEDSYAVVGQEPGLDEFVEEGLEEFHDQLVNEDRYEELAMSDDLVSVLQQKEKEIEQTENPEVASILQDELEMVRQQLLNLPKRDRFKVETRGEFLYDSNINRRVPREEKGDSVFDIVSTALIDLSGKKTDLRFESTYARKWNIVFSETDEWEVQTKLRQRRTYFSRLLHSTNSAITRNSAKTIEIDSNKIRYDFNNQMAFNFPFSRKLSLNLSGQQKKRLFLDEAFDQDSNWDVSVSPSGFWSFTPKSRVALGYKFGVSRSRNKTNDANTQDVTIAYFGQITKKSSASVNFAYGKQTPRSTDTKKTQTVTMGVGYIWQATPKSQMTFQATRTIQNSTSEITSGEVDGVNTTSREDTHFITDNVSYSLNSRMLKKLTTIMTLAMTHTRTKTFRELDDDLERRQFTFPLALTLTYRFREWLTLNLGYTFAFRTGNEKNETSRSHAWTSTMRLVF